MGFKSKEEKKLYDANYYREHREKMRAQNEQWKVDHAEQHKENKRRYHEENKEKNNAYSREYYSSHKEEFSLKGKAWREKNADKKREGDREWRESHKEQKAETDKQYREANRDAVRAVNRGWAAKNQKDTSAKIKRWRNIWRTMLWRRRGGFCLSCGYDFHHAALVFHHVDPAMKNDNISKLLVMHPAKLENRRKMRDETDKCVVLCQNCHAIEHWGN